MHLCCLRIECNLCIKLINEKWNGRSLIGTYKNIPTYIQCARLVYFITFQSIIFLGKKRMSVSILKLIEVCFHLNFFVNGKYPEIPVWCTLQFNFFPLQNLDECQNFKIDWGLLSKIQLNFFCKSEVQKNPFNEFCST